MKHPLKELPFFYFKERDWIVLNEEHPLYGFFRDIITIYLELDVNKRNVAAEQAAANNISRIPIDILDEIIEFRQRKEVMNL